ncbi:hypothetical protein ACA910_006335 [Epithemia clementina (nom. ined.)]
MGRTWDVTERDGPAWEWGALFGREEESRFLQSLVAQTTNKERQDDGTNHQEPVPSVRGATVLIHGAAGSGKSSIVKSQPWNEQYGWMFASGKFLQGQSFQEPLCALIEACNELMDQWMEQSNKLADIPRLSRLLDQEEHFLRHVIPKAYQSVKQARTTKESQPHYIPKETLLDDARPSSQEQQNKPLSGDQSVAPEKNEIFAGVEGDVWSFTIKQDFHTMDCVNSSFVRILSFLCSVQPTVLLLDDVQWADVASAKILQFLATTAQVDNLLLILSYRDDEELRPNSFMQQILSASIRGHSKDVGLIISDHLEEVDAGAERTTTQTTKEYKETTNRPEASSHALKQDETEEKPNHTKLPRHPIYDMPVSNLYVEGVNELIASLTKRQLDETVLLAEIVHKKTAGNPFFMKQFLQMLRHNAFFCYSYFTGRWEWKNVDHLQSLAHVSDNVADIVAATMERLPEKTRMALQVAACLGKTIPLYVLIRWFEKPFKEESSTWIGIACYRSLHQVQLPELQSILDYAVHDAGILMRPNGHAYMWAHDKLQAVAYSLIPIGSRPPLHLTLGRLLWQMSQEEYPNEEWMVFMAADQMNRYSLLRKHHHQKHEMDGATKALGPEVAPLCLEAARLCLAKSALYPAYDMLNAGIMHLDVPDKWENHYDLCLSFYSTLAEVAVPLGKIERTMEAVEQVKAHARSFHDKFRVQIVHLKLITGGRDRNFELGWKTSIQILKECGVRMPKKLLPGMLAMEYIKLCRRLRGSTIHSLLMLPAALANNRSPSHDIIKLLSMQSLYATMSQKKRFKHLSWFAALRILCITLDQKIVSEEATIAISFFGMAHADQGQFKEASEYGDLALKLLDRFPQAVGSIHAQVMTAVTSGIFSFTKPFNKCLDLWLEAHSIGLRTGNTEKAGTAIIAYAFTYVTCGLPLRSLQSDLHDFEKEALQFNLPSTILANFKMFEQFFLNLQEPPSSDPTMLKGHAMDQDEMLASFQGNAHRMTKRDIDSFRLVLAIIYGKLDAAELLIGHLEQFLDVDQLYVRSSMRRAFMALAGFKLCRTYGKRRFRRMARKIMKEFRESLKRGNVNALPFYNMLYAEVSPSKDKYENAIRSCARLGLIHYEAYMCEQAGLFYLEVGQKDKEWAEFYLAQAVTLYSNWGADGKVEQLQTDHSWVLQSSLIQERASTALKGRRRYEAVQTDLLSDLILDGLVPVSSSRYLRLVQV